MKIKKTKNRWNFFLIAIFFIVFCFGLGKTEKAQANQCIYRCIGTTVEITAPGSPFTPESCQAFCETACNGGRTPACFFSTSPGQRKLPAQYTFLDDIAANEKAYQEKLAKEDVCPKVSWREPVSWITCFFLYILVALGKILSFAGTLFGWIVNSENVQTIINNEVVYNAWAFVRDILNISFILFLLFSAFSTVFQVDKYSYKKTLLTLVLMALLVNFSYPITRFIIDVSNVLMFYLIDHFNIGNGFTANIANDSALSNIISPKGNPDLAYLIISIIFLFIFTVTILVITLLFVIRTIVLAILVIFSSIAFVGEAIPPLSSYASDWWKKLFAYAFFGPIMVFMLNLSVEMISQISSTGLGNLKAVATANSDNPNYIAALSFFLIPIIILWTALGIAGKMGIVGASLIVGKAEGFMKGAGKKFSGSNYAKEKYGEYKKAKDKAKEKRRAALQETSSLTKLGEKVGSKPGEWRDAMQSKLGKFGGKDAQKRQEDKTQKEIVEQRKKWKDEGVSEDQLEKSLNSGSISEKRAAALEMAENKGFGQKNASKNYAKAKHILKDDKINESTFDNKAKEKHIQLIINDEIAKTKEQFTKEGKTFNETDEKNIYNKSLGKLTNEQFAKQKDLDIKNTHVRSYIQEQYVNDPSNHQDVFKRLSGEKRTEWVNEKLMPSEKRNETKIPHGDVQEKRADEAQKKIDREAEFKSSHEDVQQERAKTADEEMNKYF